MSFIKILTIIFFAINIFSTNIQAQICLKLYEKKQDKSKIQSTNTSTTFNLTSGSNFDQTGNSNTVSSSTVSTTTSSSISSEPSGDLKALSELLTNAQGFTVNPKIMASADYKSYNNWIFHFQILGSEISKDSTQIANAANFFIPEQSKYAISLSLGQIIKSNLNFLLISDLGIEVSADYCNKNLYSSKDTTINNANFGVYNLRIALEGIIDRDYLSIFLGGNYTGINNGKDIVQKVFNSVDDSYFYADFGFKAKLKDYYFEFSLIAFTQRMKAMLTDSYNFLPYIKLGFQQDINFSK
jgi:hypothetical protein